MASNSHPPPPLSQVAMSEIDRFAVSPRRKARIDPSVAQYPSILVIGFGELGRAIVDSLIAHPSASYISVLLRPSSIPQHSTFCAKSGVNIVPGDYITDSINTLATTFASFHTIIGASGYAHGSAGVQTKIASAVLQAQAPRYFPWQFGVDYDVLGQGTSQDLFDEQLKVRKMLRAQNTTRWVIVSVGIFMSYLLENEDFGVLDWKTRTVRALGSWETRITVTDAKDIGEFTAGILMQNDPEVKDEVVFIAGETLSYGDIADMIAELWAGLQQKGVPSASGQWQRELWTREKLMRDLEEDPENGLKKYRPVFASEAGIAWSQEESWNVKRGYKATGIRKSLDHRMQL